MLWLLLILLSLLPRLQEKRGKWGYIGHAAGDTLVGVGSGWERSAPLLLVPVWALQLRT